MDSFHLNLLSRGGDVYIPEDECLSPVTASVQPMTLFIRQWSWCCISISARVCVCMQSSAPQGEGYSCVPSQIGGPLPYYRELDGTDSDRLYNVCKA